MKTLDTTRGQMLAQAKRRVKTMRTIEEIKAELIQAELCHASMKANGMYRTDIPAEEQALHRLSELRAEFFVTVANGIEFNRLEEICAAERDARLVVLPCKIGTKVYFISQDCEMCRSLQKDEPCLFGDCPYRGITETIFTYGAIGQFGKTAFLTREKAEAALRKEQSDER